MLSVCYCYYCFLFVLFFLPTMGLMAGPPHIIAQNHVPSVAEEALIEVQRGWLWFFLVVCCAYITRVV